MGFIPFNLNINLLHRFSVTFSFLRRLQIVSPFFKQHILSLDTVRVITGLPMANQSRSALISSFFCFFPCR